MQLALEAIPISELKTGPNQVVEKIAQYPLLLTQHGRSVAVMVHPQQWNRIAGELSERKFSRADLEFIIEAYRRAADENRPTVSGEELKAQLAERYGHVTNKV